MWNLLRARHVRRASTVRHSQPAQIACPVNSLQIQATQFVQHALTENRNLNLVQEGVVLVLQENTPVSTLFAQTAWPVVTPQSEWKSALTASQGNSLRTQARPLVRSAVRDRIH